MMKILLVILGMFAMTMAQDELDYRQFMIFESRNDPDNLDANFIAELERSTIVNDTLKVFEKSSLTSDMKGMPPGVLAALRNASLANAMLDDQSSINERVEDDDDTAATTTTTTTTTTAPVSKNQRSLQTSSVLQKPLWWCPYSRHILRWFPLRHCGQVTDICFIPWANFQRIKYASCHTKSCYLWNQKPKGRCHPSCYSRRRFFAVCYSLQTKWWYWRWVVLNLPQDCRCSAC